MRSCIVRYKFQMQHDSGLRRMAADCRRYTRYV